MEPRIIQNIYLVPIIMGIELAGGMIICFGIALSRGDVSPYVPFISETGAKPPVSGILGLFLVIGAFLGIITMGVRFLIVSELNSGYMKKIDIINVLSLIIGYLAMGGMVVVGVYPQSTIMAAHAIGATMLFLGGGIYAFIQTLATYWLYPARNGISIFWIRLAISITCFCFFLTMTIVLPFGQKHWQGSHETAEKVPEDKGFAEILTSALCEWLMAFSLLIFFLTYIREFRKVIFQLSTNPLVSHFDEEANELQIRRQQTDSTPNAGHV